jgi:hypothetical protein
MSGELKFDAGVTVPGNTVEEILELVLDQYPGVFLQFMAVNREFIARQVYPLVRDALLHDAELQAVMRQIAEEVHRGSDLET